MNILRKARLKIAEKKIKRAQSLNRDFVLIPKTLKEMTWPERLKFFCGIPSLKSLSFEDYKKWCADGKRC